VQDAFGDISGTNSANFDPRAAVETVDSVEGAVGVGVGWKRPGNNRNSSSKIKTSSVV